MYKFFSQKRAAANSSSQTIAEIGKSGMEIETSKNECNPKNLRVGRNFLSYFVVAFLAVSVAFMGCEKKYNNNNSNGNSNSNSNSNSN